MITFSFQNIQSPMQQAERSAPFDPAGNTASYDTNAFYVNGKPVFIHSGELLYYRVPQQEWENRIIKMKNGGLNCVSSYVFWGIHEPKENIWNFNGRYNIRAFIALCQKHEMYVNLRIGPLINSETTHGGMPNWVWEKLEGKLFPTKEWYLQAAKRLYVKLAEQVSDFFPSRGGNILFIQLDNETNCDWFFGKPEFKETAQYMIDRLQDHAMEAGFEGPFTCTYWASMVAVGAIPLTGGYPAGIWEPTKIDKFELKDFRQKKKYNGLEGMGVSKDDGSAESSKVHVPDKNLYPVFGVENQAGRAYYGVMPASFAAAYTLSKIAAGESASNYYTYSGGTNPQRYPGPWFDVTFGISACREVNVMSYDLNSPLGEFNEVRDSYHFIRRMGLMLQDFGVPIAQGDVFVPSQDAEIFGHLQQVSFRGQEGSGFIFIDAYKYPTETGSQPLTLRVTEQPADGSEDPYPSAVIEFPMHSSLIVERCKPMVFPFRLNIDGLLFTYATAQPLCRFTHGDARHLVFWGEGQVEYFFEQLTVANLIETNGATIYEKSDGVCVVVDTAHRDNLLIIRAGGNVIHLKTLSEQDALRAYRLPGLAHQLVITDLIPMHVEESDQGHCLHFEYTPQHGSEGTITLYPGNGQQWTHLQVPLHPEQVDLSFRTNEDGSLTCLLDSAVMADDAVELFVTTSVIERGFGAEVYVDGMMATDQWYRADERGVCVPWSFGLGRFLERNSQSWVMEQQPDDTVKIFNKFSGLALGVVQDSGQPDHVRMVQDDNTANTRWAIIPLGEQRAQIQSIASGRVLTVAERAMDGSFELQLQPNASTDDQIFELTAQGELYQRIRSMVANGMVEGDEHQVRICTGHNNVYEVTLKSYEQNLTVENHVYRTNYKYGHHVNYASAYYLKSGKVIL